MADYLDALKADAQQMVDTVFNQYPDAAIGIVTYGDQDPPQIVQDFTSDPTAIVNAINEITVGSSDTADALAALNAAFDLNWRPDARKAVILMTNTPPQDPDPTTGISEEEVLERSLDSTPSLSTRW